LFGPLGGGWLVGFGGVVWLGGSFLLLVLAGCSRLCLVSPGWLAVSFLALLVLGSVFLLVAVSGLTRSFFLPLWLLFRRARCLRRLSVFLPLASPVLVRRRLGFALSRRLTWLVLLRPLVVFAPGGLVVLPLFLCGRAWLPALGPVFVFPPRLVGLWLSFSGRLLLLALPGPLGLRFPWVFRFLLSPVVVALLCPCWVVVAGRWLVVLLRFLVRRVGCRLPDVRARSFVRPGFFCTWRCSDVLFYPRRRRCRFYWYLA
jgi:hypothetical protein